MIITVTPNPCMDKTLSVAQFEMDKTNRATRVAAEIGGKGINIPLIPKLEKGGVLKKGQMGFLEGNGAEAVVPLDQNRAWVSAVAKDMKLETGADNGKLQQIIDMLSDFFPQFMEASGHDIVTNDGVIVAHYAPKLNLELGKISSRKDRGR